MVGRGQLNAVTARMNACEVLGQKLSVPESLGSPLDCDAE